MTICLPAKNQQLLHTFFVKLSTVFLQLTNDRNKFMTSPLRFSIKPRKISGRYTDYGHPERAYFFKYPKLLGLGRHFGLKFFEAFGAFLDYQHPFWYCEFLVHVFHYVFNNYFYKNLSLYIQLPNIYLGLGFEFGPQRI